MYVKKKLEVETAGIGGALGPAGGALEEGATRKDPVMGAVGGAGGAMVGSALGTAAGTTAGGIATGLTGGLAAPLIPVAAGAGGMLGGAIGSGVGGEMLGGEKKQDLMKAATSDDMPSEDPIEKFLNRHSSMAEATQEFEGKAATPPVEGEHKDAKLMMGTQCRK